MTTENESIRATEFHCQHCDYFTCRSANWAKHLATKKHKNNASTTENEPNRANNYQCQHCHFQSSNKKDFSRHLQSMKHKNNASTTPGDTVTPTYICPNCNKSHNDRAGLWRHKKKCIPPPPSPPPPPQESGHSNPVHILLDIIKQDRELRNTLLEQNLLFMRRFAEMTQQPADTTRQPLL
jgi:hypothetical protein